MSWNSSRRRRKSFVGSKTSTAKGFRKQPIPTDAPFVRQEVWPGLQVNWVLIWASKSQTSKFMPGAFFQNLSDYRHPSVSWWSPFAQPKFWLPPGTGLKKKWKEKKFYHNPESCGNKRQVFRNNEENRSLAFLNITQVSPWKHAIPGKYLKTKTQKEK